MNKPKVGIVGTGIYIPDQWMTASEIAEKTNGVWAEEAVVEKLGIKKKSIPGDNDGTQEMGVRAALNALENTGMDPLDIDVIIGVGEEWKEYPLTTSALYIQDKIGAKNAWGINSMALSKLVYTPAEGETAASHAFIKVAEIESLEEINE